MHSTYNTHVSIYYYYYYYLCRSRMHRKCVGIELCTDSSIIAWPKQWRENKIPEVWVYRMFSVYAFFKFRYRTSIWYILYYMYIVRTSNNVASFVLETNNIMNVLSFLAQILTLMSLTGPERNRLQYISTAIPFFRLYLYSIWLVSLFWSTRNPLNLPPTNVYFIVISDVGSPFLWSGANPSRPHNYSIIAEDPFVRVWRYRFWRLIFSMRYQYTIVVLDRFCRGGILGDISEILLTTLYHSQYVLNPLPKRSYPQKFLRLAILSFTRYISMYNRDYSYYAFLNIILLI